MEKAERERERKQERESGANFMSARMARASTKSAYLAPPPCSGCDSRTRLKAISSSCCNERGARRSDRKMVGVRRRRIKAGGKFGQDQGPHGAR